MAFKWGNCSVISFALGLEAFDILQIMEKIVISACFLGQKVRYDGNDNALTDPRITRWQEEGRLIPLCPETLGGLPTPRPPAEINRDGRVVCEDGDDVTLPFRFGSYKVLELAEHQRIKLALLKSKSPSCGVHEIYDGSFTKTLVKGMGKSAQILHDNRVKVFDETEIDALENYLAKLEGSP